MKTKVIYACNVADTDLADGNAMVDGVRKFAEEEGSGVVVVSAQVESELVDLDDDDKREFLDSLGEKSAFLVCVIVCVCVFENMACAATAVVFFFFKAVFFSNACFLLRFVFGVWADSFLCRACFFFPPSCQLAELWSVSCSTRAHSCRTLVGLAWC